MSNPFAHLNSLSTTLPAYYDELSPAMRKAVREEYIRRQQGKCQHCHQPLTGEPADFVRTRWIDSSLFPPGFFNHPVHLHHSRETGLTIGAVHARCNAFLWQHKGE